MMNIVMLELNEKMVIERMWCYSVFSCVSREVIKSVMKGGLPAKN